MSYPISIKNYIDITNKINRVSEKGFFHAAPLFLLNVNKCSVGRDQLVYISSLEQAREIYANMPILNFIEKFFSYKDKLGNNPQGLWLGCSSLEAVSPSLVSGTLPSSPPSLSKDYKLNLSFTNSSGQTEVVTFTVSENKTFASWTDLVTYLKGELIKVIGAKATLSEFKSLEVVYDATTRRIFINCQNSTGTITVGDQIEAVNYYLKLIDKAITVKGGSLVGFRTNLLNYLTEIKEKASVVVWDNKVEDFTAVDMPYIVNSNSKNDFPKLLCWSSPTIVKEKKKWTNFIYCYDKNLVPLTGQDKYYDSLSTAFLIAQQVSATRFDANSTISDFTRIPTILDGQVDDQLNKNELELLRANYITKLNFNNLNYNLFEGGETWGDSNSDLIAIKDILGDMWLKYILYYRLLQFLVREQSLVTDGATLSKVQSILNNVAREAIENGVFVNAQHMSEETRKSIPEEVLNYLLTQSYYLKVFFDLNNENSKSGWVIRYELHYFAGNIIKKIVGQHVISN